MPRLLHLSPLAIISIIRIALNDPPRRSEPATHHPMASVRSVVGLAVLVLAGPTALVRAQAQWTEALQTCGAARYFASEYSCFGNRTLCPVMYNLPTVPCATGAVDGGSCYAPEMFSCAPGGKLETLPAASTPFTLTAHGTRATYRNLTVKACGGFLAIGANARQCTSCAGAGPGVQCAAYGNKAVLLPSGEMVRSPKTPPCPRARAPA